MEIPMTGYVPHSPAFAERMHRERLTDEELARRLGTASPDQLRQIWRDESEPERVRDATLCRLAQRSPEDPEVAQALLDKLAAPDPIRRLQAVALQMSCNVRSDPRLLQK